MRTEGTFIDASSFAAEALALFQRDSLFSSIGVDALTDLVDACDLVAVKGGTCVLHVGERFDALIGVVHGALRVVRHGDSGLEHGLHEFRRGTIIGTLGLLSDRTFPVSLYTIRDSHLLRLPRERLLGLVENHPAILLALTRRMSERASNVLDAFLESAWTPRVASGGNLALIALANETAERAAKDMFVEIAVKHRRALHVTTQLLDHALGSEASKDSERVTRWLSTLDSGDNVVLYDGDVSSPGWTARCVRQSDRLVLIAQFRAPDLDLFNRTIAPAIQTGLRRQIDLVLVHPATTSVPSGTAGWTSLADVDRVHHVRAGRRDDMERVVRLILARPIGLVLSGGGARGIAHVGVVAAIKDAGIPIDYVCGTSMGAIFAAGVALGFDVERMRTEVKELFASPGALYDFTLPISAVLGGKKLNRVLRKQLGDGDIEDLWIPFFCVSTDLSRSRMIVHERGKLWRSVRASCSIPGIFPPVQTADATLVDGGLMNNLPYDLLADRCPGAIIAVDVSAYGAPNFAQPKTKFMRWVRALRSKIRGEAAGPPLFEILMRSTQVGSKFRQQIALDCAEEVVYMAPPVDAFKALEWRAHRELYEIGYRHAAQELNRHVQLLAQQWDAPLRRVQL